MKQGRHTARPRENRLRSRDLVIYRAVGEAELADITARGGFRCPPGYEVKYFALSLSGAETYARLATLAFEEGPFSIVRSSMTSSLLESEMFVEVDGCIATLVLPADLIGLLSAPVIVDRVQAHG